MKETLKTALLLSVAFFLGVLALGIPYLTSMILK